MLNFFLSQEPNVFISCTCVVFTYLFEIYLFRAALNCLLLLDSCVKLPLNLKTTHSKKFRDCMLCEISLILFQ